MKSHITQCKFWLNEGRMNEVKDVITHKFYNYKKYV